MIDLDGDWAAMRGPKSLSCESCGWTLSHELGGSAVLGSAFEVLARRRRWAAVQKAEHVELVKSGEEDGWFYRVTVNSGRRPYRRRQSSRGSRDPRTRPETAIQGGITLGPEGGVAADFCRLVIT